MTAAYRELVADPSHTVLAYHNDYGPFAPLLAGYSGRVLDIGGGNGLVRHFLPRGADYVSLDPSVDWLVVDAWQAVADEFPCLRQPLQFVRGFAEQIPFADGFFDGALAFWSLNHCVEPQQSLAELARVLRPGGRCLLVCDDVEPPWRDVVNRSYRDPRWSHSRLAWEKSKALLLGWPLQPDHLPMRERDIVRWTRDPFRTRYRAWHGSYLAIELTRRS